MASKDLLENTEDEFSFLRPYLEEEEKEKEDEIPEEYSFLRPYLEEQPQPEPVSEAVEIPEEYSFLKPYLEEEVRATARPSFVRAEAPTLESLGVTPIKQAPEESFLRPLADPFLNIGAGINDVVKGFADAFGADNAVSQNLAKNSEWYRSLLSAGAKEDAEEIGRIMQEAEGQGVLAEIGAGLKALTVAPVDLVSQGIGSLIPFIATAGVGKAVGLSRAGVAVLQGVQGGAVGGGIVKGEIYDAVKEQLINSGVDEAKAEKAASEAQAYNGKNLDQIMLGTGLGIAASATGAEGAIRALITRKVGKEAAEQVSEQAIQEVLRTGFVRGAIKDGIVETATEALQGGQERLAANVAVGREGFDVEPMRGVFGQATLEGALGGVLGGAAGGISAKAEQLGMRESVALRDAAKAAEEAKQSNAPASAAAVEEQIEQVGETLNIPATVTPRREGETDQQWRARIERERAETPEQRVARLQEEATAAAGIELEEEGVGVEPPVAVTPPVEPTPEGAVAPVEPPEIVEREEPPTPIPTPAEAVPTEKPTVAGFTTAKGSTYEVTPEGKTVRTKQSEGEGQGKTFEPHSVLFVQPEASRSIMEDMQSTAGNTSTRIGYIQDNQFVPVSDSAQIPAYAEPTIATVDRRNNAVINTYTAQRNPETGLSPVEKLYKEDGTSSTHIGNQITEIRPLAEAAPAVTPPVEVVPTPEAITPTPAPEVRESRREAPVEIQQQYTPKTDEEQQSFDRASTNKILARSPQLAVAAVRMKNGEITAGEYADLVDVLDPFVVKGAEPVPTNEKIYQYMSKTAGAKPDSEQGRKKLAKIGAIKEDGTQRIPNGKLAEFRIDIPTYNESTKNGDTVYSITGHEPVSETAKQVGETIAHLGVAKITNPQFITRTISGKGDAVQIAMGAGKFPLATVKGNYEAITELPSDINDPDAWTEAGYNPVRSSELVDVRSKQAVVGGTEAIMVGSRVFVKNAKLEARPTGVTMGERYAKIQMPRPAGMETEAVATKLEALGFGRGGIVSVVNEPDASFEGRTIIRDGKVVAIELNAAVLKDDAAVERVLNHEIAESANADGALNNLVAGLTPKERKEINDAITRLGYAEKARTAEEAARAVELLAEGWRGRRWFDRAVARVEAWANKLGYKLTRRAAEYIAARNVSEINAEFKRAYNKFINVQGEAREGRAFVTPAENARFLELAQNPEANREDLQKMVDAAAMAAGYNIKAFHGTPNKDFTVFKTRKQEYWLAADRRTAQYYAESDKWTGEKYKGGGRIISAYIKAENLLPIQGASEIINRPTREEAISFGFDGFEVLPEDKYGESIYIVFNSEQIKQSDPVTRDKQGNVIPLSQRFQPTEADIRYSIRESRREDAIPNFSEGSPEASTLSTMAASMAKVDAASEAKGPTTYKISEIASVWMDQGGDTRQLQDMVVEYTNLTPANAAKVANAIAKQYGLQQGIAEAGAVIAEPAPEVEGAPRKTSVQRFIEQARGIRKPIVKLEVSERAELKRQIQLKAREARETRKARKEAAKEVAAFITQYVKDNEIRGPIKSRQSMALAKQALKLDVNNEKAVDKFAMYVERVIENANYDADLRQAKALVKKAGKLAKSKTAMGNQPVVLEAISNINPSLIDNPFEFNILAERYLLAFAPVTSKKYSVFPDSELLQQLGVFEAEMKRNQDELTRAAAERLLEAQAAYATQEGISLEEAQEFLNRETNIEEDFKALELEKRTSMENLLNDLSIGVQKELNSYDDSANTPAQKELISFLKKINVENLLADEKKRYIRFSNNLLANGVTYGLEQFKSIALAQDAAIRGAKDARLAKKFSAWITPFTKKAGAQAYDTAREAARKFASITQSEADTIKNIFGRQATGVVKNLLGLTDLSLAQTAANKADEQIANEVDEFYKGHTKKYGNAGVSEETNAYAAIAAYLIQRSGDKTQEDSVAYRRRLLDENIAELNNGERVQQTSEAELKQKIVNDLKGATNAEILNRLKEVNPAAYDQLIWWKDTMLPKWVDFLKAHDENFRNQANNYNTPDFLSIKYMFDDYVKLPTEYEAAGFDDPVSLRVKQAANSIKRKDHPSLPEREGVKANISIKFGKDQYNALTDQVNRAYTAPAWERVYAFTRTPEFEPIMGGRENAKFVKNMLAKIRTAQQGYGGTDIEERMMAGGVAMVRRLASQRALGGFTQMIRQTVPQLVLLAGTSTRWNLALQNMVRFHEGRELMDKFPIGQRANVQGGAKFATQYDELSRRIEASVTNRNWARFRELMKKMGELWMIPLRTSDTWVASVSWMTYYEDELNKRGIQITDWKEEARLVETDNIRKDAAGYAEQQVDQYQGSSDPTKLASLSRQSNSGWREFGRLIIMPLNSFALQEKSRLVSDVRDLFLRSGDRKDAAKGLAGTLGGMLTFHLIAIYLLGAFAMPLGKTMLAGLFGVDLDEPDEEEKEKQLQEKYQQIKTRMFSGVITGGLGQVVDETGVLAFNRLSYLMDSVIRPDTILNDKGEIVSFRQYEKEFAPLYRYSSFKGNNYSFGLADILSEQAERVMSESGKLLDEDEMSSYTQNEQAFATVATMVEAMYFAGLMDADVTRMFRAGRRQLEQQKKEEEAELARIRAGR
jgi:hypothetical protein